MNQNYRKRQVIFLLAGIGILLVTAVLFTIHLVGFTPIYGLGTKGGTALFFIIFLLEAIAMQYGVVRALYRILSNKGIFQIWLEMKLDEVEKSGVLIDPESPIAEGDKPIGKILPPRLQKLYTVMQIENGKLNSLVERLQTEYTPMTLPPDMEEELQERLASKKLLGNEFWYEVRHYVGRFNGNVGVRAGFAVVEYRNDFAEMTKIIGNIISTHESLEPSAPITPRSPFQPTTGEA
jgi:hypothetical protein